MPTLLDRATQAMFSIGRREPACRRGLCHRAALCLPPRDREHPPIFRCPFDAEKTWLDRLVAAEKYVQRHMKLIDAACAARGEPSPFPPKMAPDHLDLDTEFNFADYIALRPSDGRIAPFIPEVAHRKRARAGKGGSR